MFAGKFYFSAIEEDHKAEINDLKVKHQEEVLTTVIYYNPGSWTYKLISFLCEMFSNCKDF